MLAHLYVESDELVFVVRALTKHQIKLGTVAFLSWGHEAEAGRFQLLVGFLVELGVDQSLIHVQDERLLARYFTKVVHLGCKVFHGRSFQDGTCLQKLHHVLVDQGENVIAGLEGRLF